MWPQEIMRLEPAFYILTTSSLADNRFNHYEEDQRCLCMVLSSISTVC
jgi:hypothetical protein